MKPFMTRAAYIAACILFVHPFLHGQLISQPITLAMGESANIEYPVSGSKNKKVRIHVSTKSDYAYLSLYANEQILLDNIDIPATGMHDLEAIIAFPGEGNTPIELRAQAGTITLHRLDFTDYTATSIPEFSDISEQAGLDRVNTIKYGGPCIADIDQDGDYDFVVTNHNDETNKLYWNNGDGTVTRHEQNLSRWRLQDLHGVSCADYDGDGDLDLMQTKGGGNGKNPSLPDFYRNDNGKLTLVTLDAGITVGARGRGARWSDMDLDGDLDLVLINAKGIAGETPQHNFYRNQGDGTFEIISVAGIENANAQRALVTDLNGDQVDDFILYDPTQSIWLGNGDFTFTEASEWLPDSIPTLGKMMGAADIDIDNDGDFDLYFARGNAFGVGTKPSFNFCPVHMRMDIKIRHKGSFELALEAEKDIDLHEYDFVGRNGFKGEEFSILLGKDKQESFLNRGGRMLIEQAAAEGWPDDISKNGIYFGHIGGGQWRSAVVINGDIFWNVGFSLSGVKNASPEFIRLNTNPSDILLRNDGNRFTNVSAEWNIPQYGNHSGVTVADFNNDGFNDLFLHRWGSLQHKPADYMLLNNGRGSFDNFTAHGASDPKDEGHGDMGQAFDFDLDGDIDLLNGSDEYSMWYLFENELPTKANYALVKVGYAPHSNIDAFSATVEVTTPNNKYRKRVGSSGEVFSQSLLNIVHFGLGHEEDIDSIKVTWRNGEEVLFTNKKADRIFDTDKVDPVSILLDQSKAEVREGTSIQLSALVNPINADSDLVWTSSDESQLQVNQQGQVSAIGKRGNGATITVTCKANGLSASARIEIVKWYAIEVEQVRIQYQEDTLYVGRDMKLSASLVPAYADNSNLIWNSSNSSKATVSPSGIVSGMTEGKVEITARSEENTAISDAITLTLIPYHSPRLELTDSLKYKQEFILGETMNVKVNYCAGSEHKVVASDLGGIKFMFRQLDERWMSAGDFVTIVDSDALGKHSGSSTASIRLEGMVPTSELPEGHVYYLYVAMASSNGKVYTKEVFPVQLISADRVVDDVK